nr:hypothetical protein FVER53263_20617 [Fusarium verticillioides]
MHRTLSIDYAVVIEGEMELVLDSGENRAMKRGDVAVQRGTKHQWVNTDEEKWARMVACIHCDSTSSWHHLLVASKVQGILPPTNAALELRISSFTYTLP